MSASEEEIRETFRKLRDTGKLDGNPYTTLYRSIYKAEFYSCGYSDYIVRALDDPYICREHDVGIMQQNAKRYIKNSLNGK